MLRLENKIAQAVKVLRDENDGERRLFSMNDDNHNNLPTGQPGPDTTSIGTNKSSRLNRFIDKKTYTSDC